MVKRSGAGVCPSFGVCALVAGGDARDRVKEMPLCSAVIRVAVARGVKSEGADIIELFENAAKGTFSTHILQQLTERKIFVDQVGPNGQTALMEAAATGHAYVINVLLQHNADVDRVDLLLADGGKIVTGKFPMLKATARGHAECVQLLLKHAADANHVNPVSGNFPLLVATRTGNGLF